MTVYDVVCEHLTQQKARARVDGGTCQYRTRDNLKCAVGCLIPDEAYNEGLEGCILQAQDIDGPFDNATYKPGRVWEAIAPQYREGADLNALRQWQKYHDNEMVAQGRRFCYAAWVQDPEGNEAHSPALFHEALKADKWY